MAESIETLIIGGGQAGLSASYALLEQGREHIILEQATQAGEAWRNRWDSFTFVTPNWSIRLPGMGYAGDDPDGFMAKDEIVATFERYAARFNMPIRYRVRAMAVEQGGGGYFVTTSTGTIEARNVVVATGPFQRPKIPPFSKNIPARVLQLPSGQYRNPQALPAGEVLVVGSAQSGSQIAEELYKSGRKVYLSTSSAGRVPRRYRGQDIVWWLEQIGWFDQTPDQLPNPNARFAGNPHTTGRDGGHTLNLHQFSRDGVTLFGHVWGAEDGNILFASDLQENLTKMDQIEVDVLKAIDTFIEKAGLVVPIESPPRLTDGYDATVITKLNLKAAGISSLIWAMGYTLDFSWIKFPIFDEHGYPKQKRGVTEYQGLYFLGLNWMYKRKSAILLGIAEDAAYIASQIALRD